MANRSSTILPKIVRRPVIGLIAALIFFTGRAQGEEAKPTAEVLRLAQRVFTRQFAAFEEPQDPTLLPTDQQVVRRIDEAQRLLDDQKISHGLALLQLVLDEPVDSYYRVDKQWIRSRIHVENVVAGLGNDGWQLYQLQYGGLAEQMLQDALPAHNQELLGEIHRRFFLTEAGFRATNLLAKFQLDRGHPGLSAYYLERLLGTPVHANKITDQILAKRAIALILSGQRDTAKSLLEQTARPIWLANVRWGWDSLSKALPPMPQLQVSGSGSTQWPVFQGNAQRTAVSQGGMPMLASEWMRKITHDTRTSDFLEEVLDSNDALPVRRPALVGTYPLSMENLLVYRDFHGVWAVDSASGEEKWKHVDSGSIEMAVKANQVFHPSNQTPALMLPSLIINNSVYGTISSDGDNVYFIDELVINPTTNGRFNTRAATDGVPGNRSQNRLTALSLKTGETAWHAGGSSSALSDPLADTFFFGPPLPVEGHLYLVGESRSEIRLHCLDPKTGTPLWNQVLALSERRVDVDLFRRSLACHLVYSDGILICPTHLYRAVAIDPLTHSIIWEFDHEADRPKNVSRYVSGMPVVPPPAITYDNDAPIVQNGVLVLTSAAGEAIHGVRLQTGQSLWKIDRRNDYYLAGVFDNLVLMIGNDSARALDLETGKQRWHVPTPVPSGRGICLGEYYLLPTAEGKILAIELSTGAIVETIKRRREAPLGNLIATQGRIVSAGAQGIESFPLHKDIEAEVTQRLVNNPDDPIGLFRRAQLRLSQGGTFEAIADLRKALRLPQPATQSLAARTLLFEVAAREALAQPLLAGEMLEDLGRLASSREQKAIYLRLLAEYQLVSGDFPGALRAADQHASLKVEDLVTDPDDMVRMDQKTWGRSFFSRVEAAAKSIPSIKGEFENRLKQSAESGVDSLEQTAFLLGATSLGPRAELLLAREYLEQSRLTEAELALLRVAAGSEKELAVEAYRELAVVATRVGLTEDAAYFRDKVQAFSPTPSPAKEAAVAEAPVPKTSNAGQYTDWEIDVVETSMERSRASMGTKHLDADGDVALPYFRKYDINFNLRDILVEVVNRQSGNREWFVPLPRSNDYSVSPRFANLGHLVLLTQSDSLYAISTLERKLLWSRKLAPNAGSTASSGSQFVIQRTVNGKRSDLNIGPHNESFVVVRGINDLLVVDPSTGKPLWKRKKVRRGNIVFGDGEVLFVVSPDHSYVAHRTTDGEILRKGSLKTVIRHQIETVGRKMLLLERTDKQKVLRLWDPWKETDDWTLSLPTSARQCTADSGLIAVVDDEPKLTVVSREDGRVILEEALPLRSERFEAHVFRDSRNLFVAVDVQTKNNIFPFSISNSNIETRPINGLMRAYDRETGKLRWEQQVESTRLITHPGSDLPVLISVRNEVLDQGKLGTKVKILDKRDGRVLHEQERAEYTPFTELAYNGVEKWVELRAHNLRLRYDFLTNAEAKVRQEEKNRPSFGKLFEDLGTALQKKLNTTVPVPPPPPKADKLDPPMEGKRNP